jgi:uncharacterized protein (TIRG00374 family)
LSVILPSSKKLYHFSQTERYIFNIKVSIYSKITQRAILDSEMKISMKYLSIIGIILFIVVYSKTDIREIGRIFSQINFFYLFVALVLLGITIYIRSLKWNILVNFFCDKYSVWQAFKTYTIGVALGSATPGKAGDLIKVLDMKKSANVDMKLGVAFTIFDKIIDIIVLFGLGLISVIIIAYKFSNSIDLKWIIIPLILLIIVLIFLMSKYATKFLKPLFKILIPSKFKEKLRDGYYSFMSVIESSTKNKKFFLYIFHTLLSWLLFFSLPYLLGKSLNLNLSYFYYLLFIPLVLSIEVIPITMLGIGTRDTALILLFSLVGIGKESALSLSLLLLIIANFPVMAIGFFFAWKNKYSLEFKM